MRFHVEFRYESKNREKLFQFLDAGALKTDEPLKVIGAWIAVETGAGYALIETADAKALYSMCAAWSEYGSIQVHPVISVKDIS